MGAREGWGGGCWYKGSGMEGEHTPGNGGVWLHKTKGAGHRCDDGLE
jgi:hypothetical protein